MFTLFPGLILKLPIWDQPEDEDIFEDDPFWEIPMEGLPHFYIDGVMIPHKGDDTLGEPIGKGNSIGKSNKYEVSEGIDNKLYPEIAKM